MYDTWRNGNGEGKMMAEKKISNYEKMKNDMADVFLKYDQEDLRVKSSK